MGRVSQEPSSDHPARQPPHGVPAPDAPERQGVTGELGDPNARPGAWLWVAVALFVIGLIMLAVVRMTSDPADRAPMPAERTGGARAQ